MGWGEGSTLLGSAEGELPSLQRPPIHLLKAQQDKCYQKGINLSLSSARNGSVANMAEKPPHPNRVGHFGSFYYFPKFFHPASLGVEISVFFLILLLLPPNFSPWKFAYFHFLRERIYFVLCLFKKKGGSVTQTCMLFSEKTIPDVGLGTVNLQHWSLITALWLPPIHAKSSEKQIIKSALK